MKRISAVLLAVCVLAVSISAYAFTDTDDGAWYIDDVNAMAQSAYLTGYEDGSFRPDAIVTKGELVSIICRIIGCAAENGSAHWADGAVNAAISAGWCDWDEIPPYPESGSYDEPVSRQLALKIVMNALLPNESGDYITVSSNVSDFAELDGRYYEPVLAAYCCGIVNGDENNRLNPKSTLTRAEACAVIMRAVRLGDKEYENLNQSDALSSEPKTEIAAICGGVNENGWLSVSGKQLINENGEPVVLHGVSSHGLQWYPQFAEENVLRTVAAYGANLFRCAMYTSEGGYLSDRSIKNTLTAAVDAAIANDMYVIIDWHILSDANPMSNIDEAAAFFDEMSKKYADEPALIYEICNEPNGDVTWSGDVKPYAERIISVIRENSDGVILVGSPTWSQDLHKAAADPLSGQNIMYTCHFYAGTHTQWLRDRILDCGLPVFVSEWGTSAADGNGGVYADETRLWLDFMKENNISWANWSLCDKNESSAAVAAGANINDGISEEELTESGALVFSAF